MSKQAYIQVPVQVAQDPEDGRYIAALICCCKGADRYPMGIGATPESAIGALREWFSIVRHQKRHEEEVVVADGGGRIAGMTAEVSHD